MPPQMKRNEMVPIAPMFSTEERVTTQAQSNPRFYGYFNLICPHCFTRNKVEEKYINFQINCSNCAVTIYHAPEKEQYNNVSEIPTTQQHDDYGE